MPIFEYRCSACGKVYEELVFGDRDKKVPCPACGSVASEKLMSVIGGISTGQAGSCGESCANGSACASAGACSAYGGAGCCPHAG